MLSTIILVVGSCGNGERGSRRAPAESAGGTTTTKPTQRIAIQPASTQQAITLNSQRESAAEPTTPIAVESRPIQQRDRILSMRKGDRYRAEDFAIGTLQGHSSNVDVMQIVQRIRSFQEGLGQGTVPLDDIHESWLTHAQRSLTFYLERGYIPVEVRVGLVDIYESDRASAQVRFSGDPGVAIGEIYLVKSQKEWLVSDLQLDLADLGEIPQRREGPYEPSLYRMMNLP